MDLMLLRRRVMEGANVIDYSPYFNYYIEDGYAYITSVKRNAWLEHFGNLNIVIPTCLQGYPTRIVS